MRVVFTLKPESDVPLHRQIYEEWRQGILNGRFRGGERVPSTRELATTLGVARSTVTAAYDQLAAEGYLDSARGSGTFVCRELPEGLLHTRRAAAPRAGVETPIRLSRYATGLADPRMPAPARGAGWLHFSQWRPDPHHFPFGVWRKLINRHLRRESSALFDYAESASGYEPLRREIAAYLGRSRAVRCTAEQILMVNGSQQALDLCARLLLDRGDEVAFENPGYQGARQVFRACGANLAAVPIDADGLVAAKLSARARLVYVTPSHQFPSGVSMSVARRLELIEWARRHNAAIVEDDYDSEYRYSGPPLPAMQGLSSGAPVIYIGTFSKVMFPGLRIGYVIPPPQLATVFARAKWLTDRQTPVLEQAALADFLREGHLDRHTRRMRRLYGRRREALVEVLAKHFGGRAEVLGDEAGMHVLVRFEDPNIEQRAVANRVQLASSSGYYLGDAPRHEYVFGFSSLSEGAIREGIRRLARCIILQEMAHHPARLSSSATTRRQFVATALALAAKPAPACDLKGLGTPHKIGSLVLTASDREGEFDRISVDCPFVFHRNGLFYMTYVAFDGVGYQTGLASSQDLVHWEKRGCILRRDPGSPVTRYNIALNWILRANDLHSVGELSRVDGRYLGVYHAYPNSGYEQGAAVIGLCRSMDTVHWELQDPCLRAEDGADWEHGGLYKPCLVKAGATYHLFYNAKNSEARWHEQTGVAISTDLKRWERYEGNPILRNGPPGSPDSRFASDPCVLKNGKSWALYYFGLDDRGVARDLVATSDDLLHPTKCSEVVVDVGPPGSVDSSYAHKPSLVSYKGDLYHFYCAVSRVNGREVRGISVARSRPWS